MFPRSAVTPLSDFVHALISPPSNTLSLSVPPSLMKPVPPPSRLDETHPSQLTLLDPYPNPNPIQNPLRTWGCCAESKETAKTVSTAAAVSERCTALPIDVMVPP